MRLFTWRDSDSDSDSDPTGPVPATRHQVHYAITPQGIVPMVPVMPNGAGGFTNPAALYPNMSISGMYDDGRGGMAAMPGMAVAGGVDAGAGALAGAMVDKGRLSPPLGAPPPQSSSSMHPRFTGSPTHHHHPPHHPPHVQHQHHGSLQPQQQQQQQHMHAPAWSVGGGGMHDTGGPMGYPDGGAGMGYHDGGYRGGGGGGGAGLMGPGQDMFRGGPPRTPREGEAGRDVKDRRKRCVLCLAVLCLAVLWWGLAWCGLSVVFSSVASR